jgi:hypothetical protein
VSFWERRKQRRGGVHLRQHGALVEEVRAAAPSSKPGDLEERLRRWTLTLDRPRTFYLVIAGLILLALLVRLPYGFDEAGFFQHHADEATYFNKAYYEYLNPNAVHVPLAHGGSGYPVLLSWVLDWQGVAPGTGEQVPQFNAVLTPQQRDVAIVAYVFNALLSVGVVVATFLLANQVLPRIATLAATLLVVFDPFLLQQTGWLLTESGYIIMFVLAVWGVFKARVHPGWLLASAVLMMGAHTFRVNGLVMFIMILLFAVLYLRQASDRFSWKWVAAAFAIFFLVGAPYLAWRAEYLPGPFDYGTNQRYFTDHPWNFERDDQGRYVDYYWRTYTMKEGGEKETIADYFRNHTFGQAVDRFYRSIQWQFYDFFGAGSGPVRHPEGAALTPLLVLGLAVGLLKFSHRREYWFFHLGAAFTFLTFLWIYPVVRSVRYFTPLTPLVVILAVLGLAYLAYRTARPHLTAAAIAATALLIWGYKPITRIPDGLAGLAGRPDLFGLVLGMMVLWFLIAFAGPLYTYARARFRSRGGTEA